MSLNGFTTAEVLINNRPIIRTVAVVPAYNEERFIGSVILKAKEFLDEVIVVDDGSEDDTALIAKAAGATVISHAQNMGKGVALTTGFDAALFCNPEVIVTFDGDWQHVLEEVPVVIKPILDGKADLVVGSRYLASAKGVPKQRIVGHWGFTSVTNIFSGVYLTDSQSGFRAFSPRAVERINFTSQSFSVESEMQFLAKDHKFTVMEVPITIRYHDAPKRNVLWHGWIVLNGLIRLISQHRPLMFFTIAGLSLFTVGVILGLWVVAIYNQHQELATGTSLLVLLFSLSGIFLVFTGVVLHAIRAFRVEIHELLAGRL